MQHVPPKIYWRRICLPTAPALSHSLANFAAKISPENTTWTVICNIRAVINHGRKRKRHAMCAANRSVAWIICASIYALTLANRRENEIINVRTVTNPSTDHRCSSKWHFVLTCHRGSASERNDANSFFFQLV